MVLCLVYNIKYLTIKIVKPIMSLHLSSKTSLGVASTFKSLSKLLSAALATITLTFVSLTANATIISGTHTTAGGKSVDLQGLEWLSWDETYNYSRASIEAGAGGWLADGWRYATGGEFGTLLTSLWGGTHQGWHSSNNDGTDWLWEHFDNPNFLVGSYSRTGDLYVGATGECTSSTSYSCRGHWRAHGGNWGWLSDHYGLNGTFSSVMYNGYGGRSSVLVRATAVPEPGTLALLGIGLAGLGISRRKQKKA